MSNHFEPGIIIICIILNMGNKCRNVKLQSLIKDVILRKQLKSKGMRRKTKPCNAVFSAVVAH